MESKQNCNCLGGWTAKAFTILGCVLVVGLPVGASPAEAQLPAPTACREDVGGIDESAGGVDDQGDVTQFCLAAGDDNPYDLHASWSWDEDGFGSQTGDGCLLFDENGNGFVDYAVCISVGETPSVLEDTRIYTCTDTRPENCTGGVQINLCDQSGAKTSCLSNDDCNPGAICGGGTGFGPEFKTQCEASVTATDPFKGTCNGGSENGESCALGDPTHSSTIDCTVGGGTCEEPRQDDTEGLCWVDLADFNAVSTTTLLDACTYTSASPTSNARDCVLFTSCNDDNDCSDDNACTTDSCNQTIGACRFDPAPNAGNACDNGDACDGSVCDASGFCSSGNSVDCSGEGDQCIDASCDPAGELDNCDTLTPANEGDSCDDGDLCTTDNLATCQSGSCDGGVPVVCTPLDVCHVAGVCDPGTGLCSNPNAANGTSCGDGSSGECDAADTCFEGVCQDNNISGACGDIGVDCHVDDVCAAGACVDSGFEPADTACGNGTPTDDECDAADTCDATGTCQDNNISGACGDIGVDCHVDDVCAAGACVDSGFEPADTACGNGTPTDDECDAADTCDATGTCQDNNISGACGDIGVDCHVDDVCAAGACVDSGFEPADTACGNGTPTDDECDAADTCDATGTCQDNNISGACGDIGVDCHVDDVCAAGACVDSGFEPADTACGNGTPTDDECDAADTCDATGTCQDNNISGACGDIGVDCHVDDVCAAGACVDSGFEPADTACGNGTPTDDECDAADTCDATGTCQDNNISGACGDIGVDCHVDDVCAAGACVDSGFEPADTACGNGTPTDDECDAADTCDATGTCQDNNISGACGDIGVDCHVDDVCAAGACVDSGFEPADTACGNGTPTDDECDAADTCDATGTCQDNNISGACGDIGVDCHVDDVCAAGACVDSGFEPADTACGNGTPTDDECDAADTCDATGTCQDNNEDDGTFCGDDGTECIVQDECVSGVCDDKGFEDSGTACGSDSDTECDDPDTCDGAGTCDDNNTPEGDPGDGDTCDDDNECTSTSTVAGDPDLCDGAGACDYNNVVAGGACGSQFPGECTDPDTCDGEGECLDNNKVCAYVTDSGLCPFDVDLDKGVCEGGDFDGQECSLSNGDADCLGNPTSGICVQSSQFRLLFTPAPKIYPGFKQNATNPGQYYYNLIYEGGPLTDVTLTLRVAYPFVTQGATPVHVYAGAGADADGCFLPEGEIGNSQVQITIDDYINATNDGTLFCQSTDPIVGGGICLPDSEGYCEFDVDVTIPDCGETTCQVYVNTHLDWGLKGQSVDANPCDDGLADRYDQATGEGPYFHALQDSEDNTGPVAISNCRSFNFQHSVGTDNFLADPVQNVNVFKPISGAFGRSGRSDNGNATPGLQAALVRNDTEEVVQTGVADEDGYYNLIYKHRGRPSLYTVYIFDPVCEAFLEGPFAQEIELQGNGWAEANFDTFACTSTAEYGKGRNKNRR